MFVDSGMEASFAVPRLECRVDWEQNQVSLVSLHSTYDIILSNVGGIDIVAMMTGQATY